MIYFMLANLIKGLRDILYPKACLACKKRLKDNSGDDEFLCIDCLAKIKVNLPPFCRCCGRHLEARNLNRHICANCIRRPLYFDRAFSPYIYDGVVKELIHKFKYQGRDYLGQSLSRPMVEFIKEYNLPMEAIDLIIPVPLHKARLREREFNQAQILSNYIAREFNRPLNYDALKRIRNTSTQTGLETNQRLLNVKNSFAVAEKEVIQGKNILLIDDVLTTGATCSEAATALKEAGAGIVFVLTLAN